MLKFATLFFSVFISFNALSADSTVVQICTEDNTGDVSEYKDVSHYNSYGELLDNSTYQWNGINYIFQSGNTYSYAHDAAGNLTNYFSGVTGHDYSYDVLNNQIEDLQYSIVGGIRTDLHRKLYSYTGNLITQEIIQRWTNNAWNDSLRIDYLFDVNQNDSIEINLKWNQGAWALTDKTNSFYHPNDKFNYNQVFEWDTVNSLWNILSIDTFTYDASWNVLEDLRFEFINGIRTFDERYQYTYDSFGYQATALLEIWSLSQWDSLEWETTQYDAMGHLLSLVGDCEPCGSGSLSYEYDALGRLRKTESHSVTYSGEFTSDEICEVYYHEIAGSNVLCEGASMILTTDSGFAAYNWSTGETTQSIIIDTAGVYTVELLDSIGIWDSAAPLVVSSVYSSVAPHGIDSTIHRCGYSDFQLAIPSDPHYSYQWILNDSITLTSQNGGHTSILSFNEQYRTSGCYKLVVANGCDVDTSSATCILFSPDSVASISATGGHYPNGSLTICYGDTIVLTASEGTTYEWFPTGEITRSIQVTERGYYEVHVSDSSPCFSSAKIFVDQFTLPANPVLSLAETLVTIPQGYLQNGFTITWFYNGDTIPNFNLATIHNPPAGYYQASVTPPDACFSPGLSNILYYNQDSVVLNLGPDKKLCTPDSGFTTLGTNALIYHDTAPLTYHWIGPGIQNPNSNYVNVNNSLFTAGQSYTYILTVTDSLGKTASDTIDIVATPFPPAPTVTVLDSDTICNGQEMVRVQLSPSPLLVPYSIFGSSPHVITNGIAFLQNGGNYTFRYTLNQCASAVSSPIIIPSHPLMVQPVIAATGSTSICYGDSVNLVVQNDIYPVYQWKESQYGDVIGANSNNVAATFDGYWRVEAYDENGCVSVSSGININVQPTFDITITNGIPSVICNQDSVKLSFDTALFPNHTLQWMQNRMPIPGATANIYFAKSTGDYSLKIYPPGDSCAGVSQEILIQVRQFPPVTIIQNGYELEAISNVWDYQWFLDSVLLINETNSRLAISENGLYQVVATDYHGCSAIFDYEVSCGANTIVNDATCLGNCDGSVVAQLTGLPPFTYNWTSGATSLSLNNLCAGQYPLIVSDTLGCTDTVKVIIQEPAALSGMISIDSATCNYSCSWVNTIVVGGTAPYYYNWCAGSDSASMPFCVNSNCQVIISDNNNCTLAPISFSIEIPDTLMFEAVPTGTFCAGCSNGSIDFSVSGGALPYTITWLPHNGYLNGNSIENLSPGNYLVTVEDGNNCQYNTTVFVADNPLWISDAANNFIAEIFPNPAHAEVNIHLKSESEIVFIDCMGRIVLSGAAVSGKVPFNIEGLQKGIYLVRINSEQGVQHKKLIVQ